jgi:hypothetical protein
MLQQEAEKTFIECTELESCATVGHTTGPKRQAKRAPQRLIQTPRPKGYQA